MKTAFQILCIGGVWLGLALFLSWCFGSTAKKMGPDPEDGDSGGKSSAEILGRREDCE